MRRRLDSLSGIKLRDLSVLAYASGFTLWHYKGNRDAPWQEPGFFDQAANMIHPGDILLMSLGSEKGLMLFCARARDDEVDMVVMAQSVGPTPQ